LRFSFIDCLQISAAQREQAYNEARQRILYGSTAEQQLQDAQLISSDRSGAAAAEVDCFSAQEVAMAAAAAVFGGDDDRCSFSMCSKVFLVDMCPQRWIRG
jgi:hypothetical protein